jgi:hypothetical protein
LNYNSVTSSAITQVVNKATPTVSWSTPASITYGAALGATQLDASATPAGTFTYSPASDTVLGAGTKTLSVTFIPTDTVDYNNGAASVTLTVNKATPNVNWPTPAAITYGTALSATQLDASAAPAGTFTYSPTSGTVLGAGSRTLSATFTPSDTADYNNATATAILTVNEAVPSITWATPSPIDYGIALSSSQLNPTATIAGLFSPELCIA